MPISAVRTGPRLRRRQVPLRLNAGQRSVSVIDVPNMKFVKAIPVGEVPKRINTMVIPDGGHAATEKPASAHRCIDGGATYRRRVGWVERQRNPPAP